MSKSCGKRGPACSRRRASAIRAGLPGGGNAAIDIVRPGSHSRTITSHSGTCVEDPRPDPRDRRRPGVVELVRAVDREQLGGRPGDPHEAWRAVDLDPVVAVGQAAGDRLDPDRPARPGRDRGDDLARSFGSPGWIGMRLIVPPDTLPPGRWRARWPARLQARSARGMDQAQAVIIGGGVGGTQHRLPPGRTRLARHRARRPGRADLRLDVPFGRPRRPAALERDPDPDDDGQRRRCTGG